MPQTLKILAQQAMDLVLRSYRVQTDFFDIDDYVRGAGSVLGDYYRQLWSDEYARLGPGAKDELIIFSPEVLVEETLKVTAKTNGFYADMESPVFSFAFDQHDTGLQNIIAVTPEDAQLKRSSINERYQFQYYPQSCIVYWYKTGKKIQFFTNLGGNISEIKVLYVPGIHENALVPDSLASMVVNGTIAKFREAPQETVKKTNDLNENKIPQTEINAGALK
jgi:hypothetical protein